MGEGCGGCLEVSHQVTNEVDAAVTWDKVSFKPVPVVYIYILYEFKYVYWRFFSSCGLREKGFFMKEEKERREKSKGKIYENAAHVSYTSV